MRWLYQSVNEPPYVPLSAEDGTVLLSMQPLSVPVRPLPPTEIDLATQDPLPCMFSIYDAFELSAFEASTSMNFSAAAARSAASTKANGKGSGNSGGGAGKGGGKGENPKKFGDGGWIIGMPRPIPISEFPWGGSGETPPEQNVILIAAMSCPRFARGFRLALPLQGRREPLFFGEQRMRLDWETPLSHEFRTRHRLRLDEQVESDVARFEDVTVDKWYTPFTQQRLATNWRQPPMESFQNLTTTEEPRVDKWDTPLTRLKPWRPKMPVSVMPVYAYGEVPQAETITLDKWYTQLSDPIFVPPRIILDLEAFTLPSATADPEDTIQLMYWRPEHRLPIWPRTYQLTPPMETFPGHTDREETPTVDKYESPLTRLLPWRIKTPIAAFPFRKEAEEILSENVTLDKWYTPLQEPTLPAAEVVRGYQVAPEVWVTVDEAITVDKWYQALSRPVWPPLILTLMMGSMDTEPIEDISGLPIDYWLTLLQQPLNQPPVLPILYDPLQILYDQPYIREVPWPRRRKDISNRRGR